MTFDANGFAPATVYGVADVSVAQGSVAGGKYVGATTSLYYGLKTADNTKHILAEGLTLTASGVTFTENGDGVYNFSFDETLFELGKNIEVTVTAANGATVGTFNLVCSE